MKYMSYYFKDVGYKVKFIIDRGLQNLGRGIYYLDEIISVQLQELRE